MLFEFVGLTYLSLYTGSINHLQDHLRELMKTTS